MTRTLIEQVQGRRVWDSRGLPTIEVEIVTRGGATGRAIAPAGASTGSGEAVDMRDGGARFRGRDVGAALTRLRTRIAPALHGADVRDQASIDRTLVEVDGSSNFAEIGGNTAIATSLAALHSAAAEAGMPLWSYLAADAPPQYLPLPEVQIFGGGAHAARRLDVQDFMVVPIGAGDYVEALEWVADVYHAAGSLMEEAGKLAGVADEGGLWPMFATNEEALEMLLRAIERSGHRPGEDLSISLDIAASEFGAGGLYRLLQDGLELDSDAFAEKLLGWLDLYPIVTIEDPLAEDDMAGLARFTAKVGAHVQVVGDDAVVTSAAKILEAAGAGACNTALIKPNQSGTVTGTRAALDAARSAGWGSIVSARSGETEDVSIVHLAVGWGIPQLKVGSFARSERMAKWNEALRISEKAPCGPALPDRRVFPWARN